MLLDAGDDGRLQGSRQPVATHKGAKRILLTFRVEPAQELPVGEPLVALVLDRAANQVKDAIRGMFHNQATRGGTKRVIR
jgi:hypothetical protein